MARTAPADPLALPGWLAELHRATVPGEVVAVRFPAALRRPGVPPLDDLVEGAGFAPGDGLERLRSLPDTVGPGMRLLVVGLNPSLYAADAGVGYARPGNRFWPAALAAGLVRADRDPDAALAAGVGMTDLVKRATRAAAEVHPDEFRHGRARLERLCAWLAPAAVCVVGLQGWRAACDARAVAGPQPGALGGRPVYLMPSTSGLNAHASLAELTDHLRRAAALALTRPHAGPSALPPGTRHH